MTRALLLLLAVTACAHSGAATCSGACSSATSGSVIVSGPTASVSSSTLVVSGPNVGDNSVSLVGNLRPDHLHCFTSLGYCASHEHIRLAVENFPERFEPRLLAVYRRALAEESDDLIIWPAADGGAR